MTAGGTEPKYVYTFVAWPDETWNFDRAVFDLFKVLTARVELVFTEREFEMFRSRLSHHGFTLREVVRCPDVPKESVP
jgi:hypothetical protein